MKSTIVLFCTATLLLSVTSCGGDAEKEKKDEVKTHVLDVNSSINTEFEGKLFSIPSPIETAILIKSANSNYNGKMLNSASRVGDYASTYQRALNLGVYGADLGYATLYGQNKESLNYLNALEKLGDGLGISSAFDKNFAKRFEANSSNKDSLLVIVQDAYRVGDNFLKKNKQKDVSSLILTGGWIESMYFATELNKLGRNEAIINRIGDQKQSLETIISLMEEFNTNGVNDDLIKDLKVLKGYFDNIKCTYSYVEPMTNAEKHLTVLNHHSSVAASDEVIAEITTKINEIRTKIIG